MFTANTMSSAIEALGMALPGKDSNNDDSSNILIINNRNML